MRQTELDTRYCDPRRRRRVRARPREDPATVDDDEPMDRRVDGHPCSPVAGEGEERDAEEAGEGAAHGPERRFVHRSGHHVAGHFVVGSAMIQPVGSSAS